MDLQEHSGRIKVLDCKQPVHIQRQLPSRFLLLPLLESKTSPHSEGMSHRVAMKRQTRTLEEKSMAEAAEQSEPKEWYGEVEGHLPLPCSQSAAPPKPGGGPCTSGDTQQRSGG